MTQKQIQSIPVVRASAHDYELAALVGDDAVILGWTMADSIDRSDLLGFAIRRSCRSGESGREVECRWLRNHRRFALRGSEQGDSEASTQSDPLQQFYFLDYAVQMGHSYSYAVIPVRGTPTLKYFEAPVSVTVQPQNGGPQGDRPDGERRPADEVAGGDGARNLVLPCPTARQSFGRIATRELAVELRRLTEQARSAVFLYSSVPLPASVTEVVREVNSGRLLYGLVPGSEQELADVRRAHNAVHLSRPVDGQRLEPLRLAEAAGAGTTAYTSALVTDPWSRTPGILLWTEGPGAAAETLTETRLIQRDKRSAARLATHIFQAYTAGRLPRRNGRGRSGAGDRPRHLEPDGRWSNIYFSRHAASPKFRQREIFSGHP